MLDELGHADMPIEVDGNISLENGRKLSLCGADIFVRVHANGSENSKVSGALCCAPTQKNPFLTQHRLSRAVVNSFCDATGANNQGLMSTDTMTGINWCEIPVTIVEMGYMSNAAEEYRTLMIQGIADGIDAYFGV